MGCILKVMHITLKRFNDGLSIVIIVLCLYVLLAPLWPRAALRLQDTPPLVQAEDKGQKPENIPDKNTLVIPRLKMQQTIYENAYPLAGLDKGVWRDPTGSSPEKGKNTILSGHRFTYAGKSVFYHLDKLREGDKIVVYWGHERYEYQVTNIRVVPPWDKDALKQKDPSHLTLYTCTPLFTASNRLIVKAELND
jgi:sortase A